MSNDVLTIKGVAKGDYFHIFCTKCGTPTLNEYLGKDPTMPYFKSKCPKCGNTAQYKMDFMKWEGLPAEPAPRAGIFDGFEVE